MLMLKFFLVFSLFAIIPSIFLYFRLNVRKSTIKWFKNYFWIPTIIIVLGLLYLTFISSDKFINNNLTSLGWMVMFYIALVTPRLILSILLLIGLPFKFIYKVLTKPLLITAAILSFIIECSIFYGVYVGRYNYEVTDFTYESNRLPQSFDGYRIAQISDIHIDSWMNNPKALEQFVELVNQQKADLIVFTGDLISRRTSELDGFDAILAKLKASDGVLSILGNHDYGIYYRNWKDKEEEEQSFQELLDRQRDMGWTLLNNENLFIAKGNDSIAILGVENQGEPPFSNHGDLQKAKEGTDNYFQLLLSHNPTHWRREVLPQSNVDLMLAGHRHAMQLQVFNRSAAAWVYPEWRGAYYHGDRALYVNVGAGEVGIPFRLGAWPEITIITLKHKS